MLKKNNFQLKFQSFSHHFKMYIMANEELDMNDDLHSASRPLNHLQRVTHLVELNPAKVMLYLTKAILCT